MNQAIEVRLRTNIHSSIASVYSLSQLTSFQVQKILPDLPLDLVCSTLAFFKGSVEKAVEFFLENPQRG